MSSSFDFQFFSFVTAHRFVETVDCFALLASILIFCYMLHFCCYKAMKILNESITH